MYSGKKFLEILGSYLPFIKSVTLEIKVETLMQIARGQPATW